MEKITIFETDIPVEIVNSMLVSSGESPLYTEAYCRERDNINFFSAEELLKVEKKQENRDEFYGKDKRIWGFENLEKFRMFLEKNGVKFTEESITEESISKRRSS